MSKNGYFLKLAKKKNDLEFHKMMPVEEKCW